MEDKERRLVVQDKQELDVSDVREQINKIQSLMKELMRPDEHYGVIPGTTKPTLLKAGAEKLGFTFRLAPRFDITRNDLPNNHREYEILCTLEHQGTGKFVAQGVGSATTMETKYRYRESKRKCPACGAEAIIKGKAEYGGGWLCFKKQGGCGAKYADDDTVIIGQKTGRMENPDIADTYNTVLKIAKKRAHVDAMITACAASDIFTQDVEDMPEMTKAQKTNGKKPVGDNAKKILDELKTILSDSGQFTEDEIAAYHEIVAGTKGDITGLTRVRNICREEMQERLAAQRINRDIEAKQEAEEQPEIY